MAPRWETAGAAGNRSYSKLEPVAFGRVRVSGGFWAARQAVNLAVNIPEGYLSLERAGTLNNFELVARGASDGSQHRGPYFVDSDVYKWLEAVGWELARTPGESGLLRPSADRAISLVQEAQAADGYVHTWFQVKAPDARFTNLAAAHELYCAGHLFEAAVAWQHGLGDDRLMAVATRFADYLTTVFGPGKKVGVPGHPEVELGLVELYRATGQARYLELAQFFIDQRGYNLLGQVHHGARYRQDDIPFREARTARGHCVRAIYLACGALDVYAESGDERLLAAAVAQWEDMVARRMYITGGVGSRHRDESFGEPFELPSDRSYSETCAAIGVVMWSWRLLTITGDPRYADLIERVLFNAFAAGVSLEGGNYFYANPLQVRSSCEAPVDGVGGAARRPWYEVACCPANVMRTLSSLGRYFATTAADALQIWQYAPMHVSADVGGEAVEVAMDTSYPLDGSIRLRVERAPQRPIEIALRVPAWSSGALGAVQTGPQASPPDLLPPGRLWTVRRQWRHGDQLVLEIPLGPRVVYPHPQIDAIRGCVAFERGPLVYCSEEVDAGSTERLEQFRADPTGLPIEEQTIIGSEPVIALRGSGQLVAVKDDNSFPYREQPWSPLTPPDRAELSLVPYFAWGNRRPGETMRVWLPTA